ncbi:MULTISPECIES: glycosyltransferase [Methanoculleus]|uniref:Glycosyl transferase, family 2 n=2 Tax=Methanoculleus TaxID=45989 RepID=A3CUG1_METMJ|nr:MULTISPECIES: glycosyltransferase [Methanoculleus]ABN57011.1 glycosyl transferase, family 2 [Methanoculleus marisnigri JR1]UYU18430.1 glycosyltransferase [Methanoculleus submarinus]
MISVVVPTYNEEQNIERCLASLADQTVPRDTYEIIVVDGDSKDRTRELAEPLADRVFIQTSKRVGGARNDGAMAASGDIIATTDADCVLPRDWVERIGKDFAEKDIVQLYGTVYPIEDSFRNRLSLLGANIFSRLGYYTRTIYFTLGCNTAFDREAFIRAGMYRCIDAGDDLEIAQRMRKLGKVRLDPRLKVGFSMRRYQQFGTLKSLWEWLYIVLRGGEANGATYSQREYK